MGPEWLAVPRHGQRTCWAVSYGLSVAPTVNKCETCSACEALTKPVRNLAVRQLEEASGVDQSAVTVALGTSVAEELVVNSAAFYWCEDATPALRTEHEAVLALLTGVVDAGTSSASEAALG